MKEDILKKCIDTKCSCRYRLMNIYCSQNNEPYINNDKNHCEFAISYKKYRGKMK